MDYLESLKMENNPESDTLSRDSIYVKFDPLVSKMHLKASDAHTVVPSKVPDKRLCIFICTFIYSVIYMFTCTVSIEIYLIWIRLLIPGKE